MTGKDKYGTLKEEVSMKKKLIFSAILGFFALALLLSAQAIPQKCQEITLKGLDGKNYTLADFKGKVSLLIFWRSTCPHCRHEMPRIKELYKKYRGVINFVPVSLDTDEEHFSNYLKELQPNFLIFRSLELRPCVSEVSKIRGVPTLFLLDPNLNIVKKFEGTTSNEEIEKALKTLGIGVEKRLQLR